MFGGWAIAPFPSPWGAIGISMGRGAGPGSGAGAVSDAGKE